MMKGEFGHAKVTFSCHMLGQGQVAPVTAKIELHISRFLVPADIRELMRFLGMVGYYRKFCHSFSTLTEPLSALLKKGEMFSWLVVCQETFDKIKSILLPEPVLMAPSFKKPFSLFVDASNIGIGAVLLQEDANRLDHLVCYYFRKFNGLYINVMILFNCGEGDNGPG